MCLVTQIPMPEWQSLPDFGLYIDQIVTLMSKVFEAQLPKGELTKSMVNNYVKAGLLSRPSGKKYDREHIAQLFMVYILKQALSMESIGEILKMLCKNSVEDGYERFRKCFEEMETAVINGRVEMDWNDESKEDQILRLGIMAAQCTIRTYWMLEAGSEAGTEAGKEQQAQ